MDAGDIAGGDARENARILIDVLSGEKGSHREIVLLNSGAAIYTAGRAGSIQEGITEAIQYLLTAGEQWKNSMPWSMLPVVWHDT